MSLCIRTGNADVHHGRYGKGVVGKIEGHEVALGNLKLLESLSIEPGELASRAEAMRKEGQTVMFVAADGKAAGLIGVTDPVKETTPEAVRQLHEEGLRVVMLTGDNRTTANTVAARTRCNKTGYRL